MIESILFFSLGFLCAGFLALMVAPAIWRRAVKLTRKRVEASVPLSLDEIHADRDRLRAEFAMSTRRLEISLQQCRDKAAMQMIEIGRNQQELKRLADEMERKNAAIAELERQTADLRSELGQREEEIERLGERLAEAERQLEERGLEMEKLGQMYDEASFAASNRQIELVAREAEFERLSGDLGILRSQRKDVERRLHEVMGEAKATQDALRAEKERAAELERKLERMVATLSDREEKLERREKELARLRAAAGGAGAPGGDADRAVEQSGSDRNRLEERLTLLLRENRRLKAELSAPVRDTGEDQRREDALLRERISDLAAEVVHLTRMLDGPDSPIGAMLAKPPARDGEVRRTTSLADRIRALKESAER